MAASTSAMDTGIPLSASTSISMASANTSIRNNSAKGQPKNLFPQAFAYFFLLFTTISAISSDSFSSLLGFDNLESAIDAITVFVEEGSTKTDFQVLVNSKIVGISNFTLEFPPPNVAKRWDRKSAPLGASWTEHQTAQQGTWLAPWYPASCVHQNEHGSTPITVTLTASMSYGSSASAKFNFDYGTKSSLEIGFTTTKENSKQETRTYTVPAHSYGQVWQQQLMVWQDQQHRRCKKNHYGKNGIKCEPWSKYIRGDLPVKNGVSFGWSTGKDRMDFGSCGGGN